MKVNWVWVIFFKISTSELTGFRNRNLVLIVQPTGVLFETSGVMLYIIIISSLSTNDILKQLQITYNYLSITYISY